MAKSSTKKSTAAPKNWLFKSEPESFSIDHLAESPQQTTFWSGVRNYQARNMLRDEIQVGDKVLFYHSNAEPMAIVGLCEVVRAGYPDHTAFDKSDHHFDAKSDPENPTWFMVDVKLIEKFARPITRDELKDCAALSEMQLLKKGSRLSIQPVTPAEFQAVKKLTRR